jgi:hypothetical protein
MILFQIWKYTNCCFSLAHLLADKSRQRKNFMARSNVFFSLRAANVLEAPTTPPLALDFYYHQALFLPLALLLFVSPISFFFSSTLSHPISKGLIDSNRHHAYLQGTNHDELAASSSLPRAPLPRARILSYSHDLSLISATTGYPH